MNRDPAELPVILLYNLDRGWPENDILDIISLSRELETGLSGFGHPVEVVCLENDNLESALKNCNPARQIVFNWCEEIPGKPHSAHEVARQLEELGYIFTGASSQALQFSQDKPAIKKRLLHDAIPTPEWKVSSGTKDIDWNCFPAIVKPAYEHFSCGITHEAVVHTHQELLQRVRHVAETFQEPVLVEDFIDGREFHVSLVGNGLLEVFPIAEMDFSEIPEDSGRLCTYDSKFSPGSVDYQKIKVRLPAKLPTNDQHALEKTAIAAYRATGCRDYARMDIRQRDGVFYVLDVNPNADISPDTSLILAAELAGYSFGQFGSHLVSLAAHRHPILGFQA